MLYLENEHMNVQVALWSETEAGTDDMSFSTLTNTGTIAFNGTDIGVPIITGRYVHVTMTYNMSNNQATLDYNYTNIFRSTGGKAGSITPFNRFVVFRVDQSTATQGKIYIDDTRIESFPKDTWFWWRFEPTGIYLVDQLDVRNHLEGGSLLSKLILSGLGLRLRF